MVHNPLTGVLDLVLTCISPASSGFCRSLQIQVLKWVQIILDNPFLLSCQQFCTPVENQPHKLKSGDRSNLFQEAFKVKAR